LQVALALEPSDDPGPLLPNQLVESLLGRAGWGRHQDPLAGSHGDGDGLGAARASEGSELPFHELSDVLLHVFSVDPVDDADLRRDGLLENRGERFVGLQGVELLFELGGERVPRPCSTRGDGPRLPHRGRRQSAIESRHQLWRVPGADGALLPAARLRDRALGWELARARGLASIARGRARSDRSLESARTDGGVRRRHGAAWTARFAHS
jgi:hypothetical protein